jgi:hypothetical protein
VRYAELGLDCVVRLEVGPLHSITLLSFKLLLRLLLILDAHSANKHIVHTNSYRRRIRSKQNPFLYKFINLSRILAKQQIKPCRSAVGLGVEATCD